MQLEFVGVSRPDCSLISNSLKLDPKPWLMWVWSRLSGQIQDKSEINLNY